MAKLDSKAIQADAASAMAHGYFNACASLNQPNGTFLVEEGCAQDQAHMRADQLSGLLFLMRTNDGEAFRCMADDYQLNLLWLASQLADELHAMLPIVADEVRREAQA